MNFGNLMYSAFLSEQKKTSNSRLTFDGHSVKVGASTVAGCARKAAYGILFGEKQPTLNEFYLMRKGNVAEGVIEGNLDELGIKYERQGEYKGNGIFDFMLIHPDILIDVNDPGDNLAEVALEFINNAKQNGFKYILYELKTTNAIPTEPHDYWVRQVNLQAEYIAAGKGVSPEEIDIHVYALELNNGREKEFSIKYEVEEVLIAQDDALSFASVIEDYIQFVNKEKDAMEFSIEDVHRRVGNLCSICKFAQECLGSGEVIEFSDDFIREIVIVKDWSKQEKNIKAMKDEVKNFLINSGVKKGKSPKYAVTLKGGNTKRVIDPNSFTDEEKLALAKKDASLITVNTKAISKFYNTKDEDSKWIADEKHLVSKKTAISLMITEV